MPEAEERDRFRTTRRLARAGAIVAWVLVAVFFGATFIRGGSMAPSVRSGDVVIYRRSAAVLREGDIVYFAHAEWPSGIVHRVVEVLPDGSVLTRGDANATRDRDPVPRRNIRGVATFVLPSGKVLSALSEALR